MKYVLGYLLIGIISAIVFMRYTMKLSKVISDDIKANEMGILVGCIIGSIISWPMVIVDIIIGIISKFKKKESK